MELGSGGVRQADQLEGPVDVLTRPAADPGEEAKISPAREVPEELGLLDEGADPADGDGGTPRHLLAQQVNPPGRGPDEAEGAPDGGGLAGAVRAEEADDASRLLDPEVEVVDGEGGLPAEGSVLLAEPRQVQDCHGEDASPSQCPVAVGWGSAPAGL